MAPPDEDLAVTLRHDIYPGIEPSKFKDSARGKAVFITGASRGIGEATAVAFAQAGASVFLVSRKLETLKAVKETILKVSPQTAVGLHTANVAVPEEVDAAVRECISQFGRIDIAIANAGTSETFGTAMMKVDPNEWWLTWEVNIRGTFNTTHYVLPHLVKAKGSLLIVGSNAAQMRWPGASAYFTSKHALNRFAELVALEYGSDGVKAFAVHPGSCKTELAMDKGGSAVTELLIDDVKLPAFTMVRLASGSDDYLSGRWVASYWDLDEVASRFKESIVRDDALKNRLAMPIENHEPIL